MRDHTGGGYPSKNTETVKRSRTVLERIKIMEYDLRLKARQIRLLQAEVRELKKHGNG